MGKATRPGGTGHPRHLIIAVLGILALISCRNSPQEVITSQSDLKATDPGFEIKMFGQEFDFCPGKKKLNATNMFWLSMISRSLYRHFSVTTGELRSAGFGSDIDRNFFRKLDLQIRLTQLKAGYPTMDDPWSTEDERLAKIKDFFDAEED